MKKNKSPRNKTLTITDYEREQYKKSIVYPSQEIILDSIINKTICSDLYKIIDKFPPAFVDLLIIDPPYNLDKDFNGNITLQETYEGESSIEQKVQENLKKLFLDNKDSFIYNISYGEKYFTQALNYVLETMEKSETLDKDKWEQIRKDNYLKLDGGYLRLDLELISTLDQELLKKLLKSFEESTNSFSQVSSPLNQNETTKEFLNRTNIVNKETEIYV